jgi:eukaryotic-like serine/threonine-protein kinase
MIGKDISHYKILEKLGEGGMGVVYRARDTKLDRSVALKFLPQQLTLTDENKQRFIREAKSAATLNHPNVCTIYDIQEYKDGENGQEHLFIVMEYVEGQTLRDKINTLTFKQAIEFGTQIADGLAAAHEHGIVHRDIKPENIMIRKDGRVIIMDFGLAKMRGTATRITKEGSTVGTAGYMSPEQIQGMDTDHRSDIFSLGVVLYEMFTRQMPFKGVHETALAYEIVNVDPEPLSAVNTELDSAIDTIVLDCLEKEPVERCQSAAEAARNLRRFKRSSDKHKVTGAVPRDKSESVPEQLSQPAKKFQPSYTVMSVVGILLMILIALLFFRSGEVSERRIIKAYIHPAPGTRFHYAGPDAGPVTVSPDGTMITYTGTNAEGRNVLWVRSLDALEPRVLRGTENAMAPFWSHDSRHIGFFADNKLRIVSSAGGIPESIADVWMGFGGSWNANGDILYSGGPLNPIQKISASGGEPVTMTNLDESRGENGHRWPYFLPDGVHFLYFIATADPMNDGVYIGSTESDMKKLLFRNLSQAIYVPGSILFVRDNTLYVQSFNTRRLEFTGDPVPVINPVMEFTVAMSYAVFSASQNGILTYHSGDLIGGGLITLSNREGEIIKEVGEPRPYGAPRLSPDGSKIAVNILDPLRRTHDIWWIDVERNVSSRLTYEEPYHYLPIWSPDGNYLAFGERTGNIFGLRINSLFNPDDKRMVFQSNHSVTPVSWSPDGRYIAVSKSSANGAGSEIWLIPLDENEEPFPVVQTQFTNEYPAFSPDGRWLAYESDETGRPEVYVRPFPGPGRRWQVSTGGGSKPVWTKNGREIVYLDQGRYFTAVEIRLQENSVNVGETYTLFSPLGIVEPRRYDVSADGETIIYSTLPTAGEHDYVTLIVNWDAGIQ